MKNIDVEALLNAAADHATPDVLDSILSRCEERESKVVELKPAATISWIKPLCATAAALALIVGGMFGANGYKLNKQTDSVVSLDVNPSIEIEANRNDKVLAIRGLNSDGEAVLEQERAEGTKLEGEKLDEVVASLVDSMVEVGYLSELANSVLVTVDNADTQKSAKLEHSLMQSVSTAMSEKGVEGAVIGQSVTADETLQKSAEKLGVSKGKAGLITAILAKNPDYKAEDLAKLSINDLGVLTRETEVERESESITIVGIPSTKAYVTAEAAINEVCAGAKVAAGEGVEASAKISVESGKLVYDVSLKLDSKPVTCAVDAITGEIIGWLDEILEDIDYDDYDYDDDDDDDETDGKTKPGGSSSGDTVGGAVGSIVGGVTDGVGSIVGGVTDGVGSIVGGVTDGVGSVVGGVTDGVGGVVGGVTDGVGSVVGGVTDGVGSIVGGVVDGAGGIIGSTADGVGDVVGTTVGGVGSVVGTTIDGVGSIVDTALTDPSNIEDTAEESADKIEEAAEEFVDDVEDAAKDFVDRFTGGKGGTTGGTNSGGSTGGSTGGSIGSIISSIFS